MEIEDVAESAVRPEHGGLRARGDFVGAGSSEAAAREVEELRERCARQAAMLRRAKTFAERFEAMAERTADCIAVLEPLGEEESLRCTYLNASARRVLGDKPWIEHLAGDELRPMLEAGARDGEWAGEAALCSHDGFRVPLDLEVQVHREGEKVRFYGVVARDLRERKKLESKLVQAQKLEAVGQLAAGVAHEINTPMQYIGDNTQFLKQAFVKLLESVDELIELAAGDGAVPERQEAVARLTKKKKLDFLRKRVPRALDAALEGVESVSSIVGAMRAFGEAEAAERSAVALNSALETTITVCRHEWKSVAVVETEFGEGLEAVPAYPTQLNQAFLNVLVNAAHAIRDAKGDGQLGTIRVRTAREGGDAVVRIADDGPGIPEAIRDKIFDPFFTTHEVGSGRGQGLAVVRSIIVDQHRGSVEVNSAEGVGTEFVIRLPLIAQSQRAPAP